MKDKTSFSTTPIDGAEPLSPTRSAVSPARADPRLVEHLPPALRRSSRFEVREVLGRGSFGEVFLAYDHRLSRSVALKVPRSDKLAAADSLNNFLREARAAASLRHPGIVTVYDVHSEPDGLFIVLEYIEGWTLSEFIARRPASLEETVRLTVEVAQAVAYAHEHGLVHRDLKPSNILIDAKGKIRITDFGLAIHERVQGTLARDVAGTPAYMAPEQVRGETHRLDGRTDLWALGVIFFWLLTGRRPFNGAGETEVFEEILHREPRPPRQVAPAVPRELERICLKCLAKRMSDRYATAHDLADDLMHWLEQKPQHESGTAAAAAPAVESDSSSSPDVAVVPKGLRAFDEHDADFFLALLPGPFDRHGLPESIRFWKQRIEETDPSATFPVGLMYGPSGCGKTSLVRAGLLPRLTGRVRWVYLEAASEDTENRLHRALTRAVPTLPPGLSLIEVVSELREGSRLGADEKVFIVLDQFEQWLNGREADENEPLVAALRQCDGGRVQCLVMVRDDFSMAATRFMNALEVPIAEGQNCAAVDVFHRDHARRVLRRFGEAFGRLAPEAGGEEDRFLDQAVELLSEGNAVAPVRLAAFAELMRRQEWKASSLRKWGGSQELGVALLERCLGDEISNPAHRQHREAARRVLDALMPEDRTSLKGRMRSQAELMAVAGYEDRPRDFRTLLNILDKELRLITPADPQKGAWEDSGSGSEGSSRRERHYQLTHDYLVPSLNVWLAGKQRETRRGRAELRLEERSLLWSVSRERRQLPTASETARILLLTRRTAWTPNQAAMMRQAVRTHLTRTVAAMVVLLVVAAAGVLARHRMNETARVRQAEAQVNRLLTADIQRVPEVLAEMEANRDLWRDPLGAAADRPESLHAERLRANLALAPQDRERIGEVIRSVTRDDHHTIGIVRELLAPFVPEARREAWQVALDPSLGPSHRLRAAALLAAYDPAGGDWEKIADDVAEALVTDDSLDSDAWSELLRPAREPITPALVQRFTDRSAGESERVTAARVLARIAPVSLRTRLLLEADAAQFSLLFQSLVDERDAVFPVLEATVAERPIDAGDEQRLELAHRQRNAAAALIRFRRDEPVEPLLVSGADPTTRTLLILTLKEFGVSVDALLRLESRLVEPTARQAVWLALGGGPEGLSDERRRELAPRLASQLTAAPHQAERSAAEWLLRAWGRDEEIDQRVAAMAGTHGPDWRINSQGQTLRVVRGPVTFSMGSPPDEPGREHLESQHLRRIDRSFAVGVHEVTIAEYLRFDPDFGYARDVSLTDDSPVTGVSWLDAARYCRWLSEQEGIAEDQMCYPPVEEIAVENIDQMTLPEDLLSRTGYRLPTEAEWEYVCRAGAATRWFFGVDERRLPEFAWGIFNSRERCWPVGSRMPNPFGLFDMTGNVHEWCHDGNDGALQDYSFADSSRPIADETAEPEAGIHRWRAFRGGAYRSSPKAFRSAQRYTYPLLTDYSIMGFRIARTVPSD